MPSFKIIRLVRRILEVFNHIWAWQPSWSCDLDHLYKLLFTLPMEAPYEIWLLLAKPFQKTRCLKIMVIYIYIAPLDRERHTREPLGLNFFHKHKSSINLVISCKFFIPIKRLCNSFLHSNTQVTKFELAGK